MMNSAGTTLKTFVSNPSTPPNDLAHRWSGNYVNNYSAHALQKDWSNYDCGPPINQTQKPLSNCTVQSGDLSRPDAAFQFVDPASHNYSLVSPYSESAGRAPSGADFTGRTGLLKATETTYTGQQGQVPPGTAQFEQ